MTKELRHTLVLLAIATSFLGTGIWQTHAARARDSAERQQQSLPPPEKTRQAVRPASIPFSGDPVADYQARCQRGMTDQEILWIIDDFNKTGIVDWHDPERSRNDDHFPILFAQRAAQQKWYLDALVEGLHLSPEQTHQAAVKLNELFDLAKAEFIRAQAALPPGYRDSLLYIGHDTSEPKLFLARWWLLTGFQSESESLVEAFAPWNLCTLTPEQQQLTWKNRIAPPTGVAPGDIDKLPPPQDGPDFQTIGPLVHHSSGGNRELLLGNAVMPFLLRQQYHVDYVGAFTPEQSRAQFLANVHRLHPAQLKIVLLLVPNAAGKIQRAMESGSH